MTRTEYLAELQNQLRKLPQDDFKEAMDYFTEYFDEAGPEHENQVIADLGSTRRLTNFIFHNSTYSSTNNCHCCYPIFINPLRSFILGQWLLCPFRQLYISSNLYQFNDT